MFGARFLTPIAIKVAIVSAVYYVGVTTVATTAIATIGVVPTIATVAFLYVGIDGMAWLLL